MRVLVVEDERRLAAAVKRGLEASGFVVDVACDGVTGLHMAREGGYDGVVLDIMLPGLSGYKVCAQPRGAPAGGAARGRPVARPSRAGRPPGPGGC